ncbi:MAG: bifunctional pyr operon transcriptional regulator/uracil phosphoribosyltransferase PyrR [Candidatus Margulisbacteria bacterium]|nr:bifunctional pyr operon transcriptional regulator/uracil phosphoribosyltransferase PyrR [Candidatus Margulisiibacteriota bacterium]
MKKINNNIDTLVKKIADEIIQSKTDLSFILLVGILTRGYPIAQRIADLIKKEKKVNVPVGKLDITLYRDDLEIKKNMHNLKETLIPVNIENKTVILVDDVLYHGRTVRAAIEHLLDYGRPKRIQLAVLIDRGHRELPVCADYIGLTIQTEIGDTVQVKLVETDGTDKIEKNE